MTEQNQQPTQFGIYPPQVPAAYQQNDEIDLKDLFIALWNGKLTIIITTVLFAVVAVAYALMAQQWWSSKAKVSQPQLQDIAAYQQQVKQFQPIFDIYQDDGTVLVSEALDDFVDTEILFQRFVDTFNSSDNKRKFLNSSDEFKQYKAQLDLPEDLESEDAQDTIRSLYATWFQKITAVAEDKKAEISPYDLNFQSVTKESSYSLLNSYLEIIGAKTREDALNNLQAVVNSKHNELLQQKRILETQAKNLIEVEAKRAEYALDIAKAANVDTPIQSSNDNEIFSIDLGTKGLAAKVNALKSITNLSVIEPRLQQIDAKLAMLKDLKIDRNIQFQTFRFLENVEQPISRDKPKRPLIAVLGTLLGSMLGVAIVLIRFAFRKDES
ncbi:LPS O-antigen chain length determinant protein WzzB [Vibrio diazotrophicus]|uniref:LPS O-antigen chain length determinant protein WzzB n=1 Tax=Vibrio diazotrophicus TaxID=685 RepID=UPI000C9E2442|nr:Wzz/FepE/Etk N-terminal domain-containing protein [Vibrio diazotrophicus]PNH80571.1 LPS chain length-determining protein [Vibrio diazotrophicus]